VKDKFHFDENKNYLKLMISDEYLGITLPYPCRALSSAVLNGGEAVIDSILNLKVDQNFKGKKSNFPPPSVTLKDKADHLKLGSNTAGLMTAADMKSLTFAQNSSHGIHVFAAVTAGLSNARAAGDPADYIVDYRLNQITENLPAGTINTICGINLNLSAAALAEALILASETRTACIMNRNIKSRSSDRTATGTGTDAFVVFCGSDYNESFCGKHTLAGQLLGQTITEAMNKALDYCRDNPVL